MTPQLLKDSDEAEKVIQFLCGSYAFHWQMTDADKVSIRKRVMNSLDVTKDTTYWYLKNSEGEVVGAGALAVIDDTNDGYYLGWFAVHAKHRKQGLGRTIIEVIEQSARAKGGRFITIDTGDNNLAVSFYEKMGYEKVGFIPNYYSEGVSKIVLYKKL